MKKSINYLRDTVVAVFLAALMFLFANRLVAEVKESAIITQSRILSSLIKEDSLDLGSLLKDKRKQKVAEQYVLAVTNAYVNFEHIPYNEGGTFSALLSSLTDNILISDLSFYGRDLIISGECSTTLELYEFQDNLEETAAFEGVDVDYVESGAGIAFSLLCKSEWSDGQPALFNDAKD